MLKNIDKLIAILLVISLFLVLHLPLQRKIKETCNFSWYVVDGDTLYINNTKIRLYGIDAPELHKQKEWVLQKTGITNTSCLRYYGYMAKDALIKIMNSSKCIKIEYYGKDIYYRTLAKIYACNTSDHCIDIGKYLVAKGLAISFGNAYTSIEHIARHNMVGLWSCTNS